MDDSHNDLCWRRLELRKSGVFSALPKLRRAWVFWVPSIRERGKTTNLRMNLRRWFRWPGKFAIWTYRPYGFVGRAKPVPHRSIYPATAVSTRSTVRSQALEDSHVDGITLPTLFGNDVNPGLTNLQFTNHIVPNYFGGRPPNQSTVSYWAWPRKIHQGNHANQQTNMLYSS